MYSIYMWTYFILTFTYTFYIKLVFEGFLLNIYVEFFLTLDVCIVFVEKTGL